MFRLPPPRGRVSRLVLLAVLVLTVLAVAPAGAVEAPEVAIPGSVGGRDALSISVSNLAVPVTVEIRDAAGATSSWSFPADADALVVDLDSPHSGAAPANGKAAVKVRSEAIGVLLSQLVTLNRDPATPQLSAVVRGDRVGLFWDAVAGPAGIVYRLQRTDGGSQWQTIAETSSASGHTDRGLAPGRYRYRLLAWAPGSDGQPNTSGLTAAQVRIAAPEPQPQPEPAPEPDDDPAPADNDGGAASDRDRDESNRNSRNVSATGSVRGPVQSPPPSDGLTSAPASKTPLVRGTADAPAVSAGMPATQTVPVPVQTPQIAPAAAPTPLTTAAADVPALDYFPVIVPPAGSLAVEAAGAGHDVAPDVVTLLAGVAFLALATGGFRRRRRSTTA